MADTSQFMIGAEVSCTDGAVGKVSRVIVDPVAEKVTHLPPVGHRSPRPDLMRANYLSAEVNRKVTRQWLPGSMCRAYDDKRGKCPARAA
jgi:hypothetical protein